MVVLGLDPGSQNFGVGIVEKRNSKICYLFSENLKLRDKEVPERMKVLWYYLKDVITRFNPDEIAIEEGYLGKNVKSMDLLSKIRGMVVAASVEFDRNLTAYSPKEVKKSVTGYGSAEKDQVMKMVKILLKISSDKLTHDESDALAVAYSHALRLK